MAQRKVPFLTLREAIEKGWETFSVCACVVQATEPQKSPRGTDHHIHISLSDPSIDNADLEKPPTITAAIFGPPHALPKLAGQLPAIIHLHSTKRNNYNGTLQLLVRLRPARTPQDGDTFCLYTVEPAGGNVGARPLQPIQTSHSGGRGLPQADPERLRQLRSWILERGKKPVAAPAPPEDQEQRGAPRLMKIREVTPPVHQSSGQLACGPLPPVDMICKVLAVDFCHAPEAYVLHVWDGTDAVPVPFTYTSSPHEDQNQQQPANQHAGPREAQAAAEGQGEAETAATACNGDGTGGPPIPKAPCTRKRANPSGGDAWDGASGLDALLGGGEPGRRRRQRLPSPLPQPPLHRSRLHMPLATIAQYGGAAGRPGAAPQDDDATGGGGGAGGDGGGGARTSPLAGWKMLSAVLVREEMPVAGSAVPVLLPAKLFTLAPPAPEAAAGPAANGGAAGGRVRLPHPGEWVKLKNVTPRFVQGQLQLQYGERSYLTQRTPQQSAAAMKAYAERLALRDGAGLHAFAPRNPDALLARAYRSWQALPLRTLRQVLMQQDACDCTPARVRVRVVALRHPALPPSPPGTAGGSGAAAAAAPGVLPSTEDRHITASAVLPAAMLQSHAEVEPGSWMDRGGNHRTYALALLLEDATASLRAFVAGGAANIFLWDYPPPDDPRVGPPAPEQGPDQPQLLPPLRRRTVAGQPATCLNGAGDGGGGVRTRARAAADSQGAVHAAESEQRQGQQQAAAEERRPQTGQGQDEAVLDRLIVALRKLADQSAPSGAWMECVLRPFYRDRRNPWQSAVYTMEHTRLRPLHPQQGADAGEAAPGSPAPSI